MVDQSELPFRQLCRRHGAHLAYTPMLHSRLFVEGEKYREEHFTTCKEDRPVLAQFCSNDPGHLLSAAKIVAPNVDGVDLNLGCPQRIAKRGRYGAFLMEDLGLVERMVSTLAKATLVSSVSPSADFLTLLIWML
jgi:tRNA-dihydrouridine synthase 1